jgi:carbon monoxide dehydrogenase subunit G
MLRLEESVAISRPVANVWDFMNDLKNSPRWTASGSELRLSSGDAMAVGATIESHRMLFGRFDVKSQALTLTEYEPYHSVGVIAKIGIAERASMRVAFEPTVTGTRLTRSGEIELIKVLRPIEPLLARVILGGWRHELGNIKRLLEVAV